jgi:aspartyl-tRNA(Asn)/glutamyl-tRNA(Gln) amidotransferase subunit A
MSDAPGPWESAAEIAEAVAAGAISAQAVTEAALARIAERNPAINAFTDVTRERALAEAGAVDAALAAGRTVGPLAGVPFAVKNLFDVAGLATRAGSRINRERPPASRDAALVRRLNAAGGVLVGALNMGEYAYDFTGRNAHDGNCRNPHDPEHMTGGSSAGSGAATAAGLAPISLGSDTNGSIRVPASLCGIFGLKPTYGRLTRAGTFPFVDSLDHVGPLARCARDLALAYDAMQGHDPQDHACAARPAKPVLPSLDQGIERLRIGVAGGWIAERHGEAAHAAIARVTEALSAHAAIAGVELAGAAEGRAAAHIIANSESAAYHLPQLRQRAADYDPETRDRFLAGALIPAAWVARAQRVRRWWLGQLMAAFETVDLIIAAATPCPAPRIDQDTILLGGVEVPARPNLGALSQPFSCVGLPIVAVPVFAPGDLPIGVQLIAPPWREDLCLRAARYLEAGAVAAAHPPALIHNSTEARN